MAERVRLAELADLPADPHGTLRDDDKGVAARVRPLVGNEERDEPLEVEWGARGSGSAPR